MNKFVLVFLLMGLTAGAVRGADDPVGKKAQLALTLSGFYLVPDTGSTRSLLAPGLRVDLNLGKSFILAPEASLGFTGLYVGGTFNYRLRKFFVGAGGGLIYFYKEAQDIQGDWVLKIQAGAKGSHWLVAAAYVSNILSGGWLNGVHLTAGYIF